MKSFASLVMVNSAAVFLYMCRLSLTAISARYPRFLGVFSSHRWTQLHVAAALGLMLGGFVHAFIWIGGLLPVVFAAQNVTEVPGAFQYIYLSSASSAAFIFSNSVGLTGFLLMLLFVVLLSTTVPKLMRKKFEVFIFFHQFMWLSATVLLGVHACQTTGRPFPLISIFLFPAVALYLGECCVRLYRISFLYPLAFHEVFFLGKKSKERSKNLTFKKIGAAEWIEPH